MSTKTTFKRVALVAAVAAAFGGLSTVAANASATDLFHTGTGSTIVSGDNSAALSATAVTGTYVPVTLTFATETKPVVTLTSSGVGTIAVPSIAAGTSVAAVTGATSTSATIYSSATSADVPGSDAAGLSTLTAHAVTFTATSSVAGVQTISVAGSSGTSTATITWGAAPVVSAANSLVVASNSTHTLAGTLETTTAGTDSSLTYVATAPTTQTHSTAAAAIYVQLLNNASPTAGDVTTDAISATVSGPANLKASFGSSAVSLSTVDSTTALASGFTDSGTHEFGTFEVFGNGTAGTATVTLTDSTAGVTLGTVSIVFYSTTVAKLNATVVNGYVPVASVANYYPTVTEGLSGITHSNAYITSPTSTDVAAVEVAATDANGNAVGSSGYNATNINVASSNTSVATVQSTANYDVTNGFYYPVITPVSEGTTTLTFTDAATGLVSSTAVITVVKAVASTVSASTDSSSYGAGTTVKYLLTAKDAVGNPVADGTYRDFVGSAATSNYGLQGTLPGAAATNPAYVTFSSGVSSTTIYAPAVADNVTIVGPTLSGTSAGVASALQSTTVAPVTFAVTTSTSTQASAATDAANEATDAANAATDAANAAADAADAATSAAQDASAKADAALAAVNALSAKITVLAAQIAKIVKKLKA